MLSLLSVLEKSKTAVSTIDRIQKQIAEEDSDFKLAKTRNSYRRDSPYFRYKFKLNTNLVYLRNLLLPVIESV